MSGQIPQGAERRSVSLEITGHGNGSERPSKVRRIRLACLRCQTRKIKCDGTIPRCSACERAGAECIDGKTTVQEGAISRSEATSLHDKIHRLEQVLRTRCPDVDITEVMDGHHDTDSMQAAASATNHGGQQGRQRASSSAEFALPTNTSLTAPTSTGAANRTLTQSQDPNEVAHEIGLIPLSAGVNKYIGPSSGFSFAKLLFARAGQAGASPESTSPGNASRESYESPSTIRSRTAFTILPTPIPGTVDQAIQLSNIYFEHVHIQYPFLHEPSHHRLIQEVYRNGQDASKVAWFQVTMVLAISATILSKRLRIPFTGEGLCATAMEYVGNIDFQNSTQGVQCLLLIAMFTLHSPFLGISPWYLNYQCLAAVLDLGLQRDVPTSRSVSLFEREMRTRMFWVIYSLDRTLATTLGRPIGLRDEACDLRLPSNVEDVNIEPGSAQLPDSTVPTQAPGPIACSILLFWLALINSEIKYILHSLTRETPRYTYPQITDINAWQGDLWERLQAINKTIPNFREEDKHLSIICQIRYHEIVMLLFRPTPRIRTPTKDSLEKCHQSAQDTVQLWKELYETDRMSYSWVTIHSVCLSAITLLYCIWMVPDIAASTKIDILTNIMRDASNLLSAAGEHWTEARRSRNNLDSLTAATVRWLIDTHSSRKVSDGPRPQRRNKATTQTINPSNSATPSMDQSQYMYPMGDQSSGFMDMNIPGIDTYINYEDLAMFVGAPDPFTTNFSDTMEGMFSAYQPLFDFNPPGDMSMGFLGL